MVVWDGTVRGVWGRGHVRWYSEGCVCGGGVMWDGTMSGEGRSRSGFPVGWYNDWGGGGGASCGMVQ